MPESIHRRHSTHTSLGLIAAACLALLLFAPSLYATSNSTDPSPQPAQNDLVGTTQNGASFIGVWTIPRFVVDQAFFNDTSTLWAVRNEEDVTVTVTVIYRNRFGNTLAIESFGLFPREIMTRNVRDVPGFPGITGYVDGSIDIVARRITHPDTANARVSIDTFTVDSANDFANGGKAHNLTSLCRSWSSRFMNFGSGPSQLDVLTNQGPVQPPQPTVTVSLYGEDGVFLTTFEVFEDHYAFTINIGDHTTANFGSAELDFGDGRSGTVSVRHSALGRFSVGYEAYCADEANGF